MSITTIARASVASIARFDKWPAAPREYMTARLGIDCEGSITRAGITYAGQDKAQERTGHRRAGIIIPMLDFKTGDPIDDCVLRPIPGDSGKFLNRKGSKTGIYFAPLFVEGLDWPQVATDTKVDIYIAEGPIKALRLAMEGRAVVCGSGINGLGGKKHGYKKQLKFIKWKGRRVVLVPDSDWRTNANVRLATSGNADHLRSSCGANVYIKLLQGLEGYDKAGVDDIITVLGIQAFDKDYPEVISTDDRFAEWRMRPEVAELNKRHAVITLSSGVFYLVEPTPDYPTLRYLRRDDLLHLYEDTHVQVGTTERGAPIIKTKAQIWLESEHRRQYNGARFDPSGKLSASIYNLWRGFAYAPKPGDWGLLRGHIRTVLASGNEDHDHWIMNWLAYRVQHLNEPLHTVLVLCSQDEGVGKGTFAEEVGALFGSSFITASDAKTITGNFNKKLETALLVFADEAFFAGDRRQADALQAIVTAKEFFIEPKGREAYTVPNRLAFIMASNHAQVVRANVDARRYAIFEVSARHKNDLAYFTALRAQMRAGGYAAMLHELLHYECDLELVRRVPQTKALVQQKILSLKPCEAFLFKCLCEGKVHSEHYPWPEDGPLYIEREELEKMLRIYLNDHDAHDRRSVPTQLGITIKRFFEKAKLPKKLLSLEYRCKATGKHMRRTVLPDLPQARRLFEGKLGRTVDWAGGVPVDEA